MSACLCDPMNPGLFGWLARAHSNVHVAALGTTSQVIYGLVTLPRPYAALLFWTVAISFIVYALLRFGAYAQREFALNRAAYGLGIVPRDCRLSDPIELFVEGYFPWKRDQTCLHLGLRRKVQVECKEKCFSCGPFCEGAWR